MSTILTEWEIPVRADGVAGNYHGTVKRNANESWASKVANAGLATDTTLSSVEVDPSNITNQWTDLAMIDVAVDMSDKLLLTASSAEFHFYCYEHFFTGAPWGLASNNKYVVCQQNEDVRGTDLATANYQEVIQGANGPSSVLSDTWYDMTVSHAGTWLTFSANATGLDYLNTVGTKAYLQGTALFSLVPYGVATGTTPVWNTGSPPLSYNKALFNSVWLSLYYDDTDQAVQITPAQGPSQGWDIVEAAQICVSQTWRDVVQVKVCINETWETVR